MPEATAISGVGSVTSAVRPRLTVEEVAQVAKLAARDREVRLHEAQHMAAAGSLAVGGPQFTYQTGPDGKLYAVGGEVKLSVASGQTPEETISRAAQMRAAATAPRRPFRPRSGRGRPSRRYGNASAPSADQGQSDRHTRLQRSPPLPPDGNRLKRSVAARSSRACCDAFSRTQRFLGRAHRAQKALVSKL